MTAAALITCAPPAKATTYYWWDTNGATVGQGGTGAWNSTATNWVNGGPTFVAPTSAPGKGVFSGSAIAVFSGTSGTTTLASTTTLNGLISLTNQTITSAATVYLTFDQLTNEATPKVVVGSGTTLNLATGFSAGSQAFTLGMEGANGGGILQLSAVSAMTGVITVANGQLKLANLRAVEKAEVNLGALSQGISFSSPSSTYVIGGLAGALNYDFGTTNLEIAANSATYTGVLSGSGTLTKSGIATSLWTLSGANLFTSSVNVTGGGIYLKKDNLNLAAVTATGAGSKVIIGTSGSLGDVARMTTIGSGSQLRLDATATPAKSYTAATGEFDINTAEPLYLSGRFSASTTYDISAAALYNYGGINQLTGDITIGGHATTPASAPTAISAAAATKLFLAGQISVESLKSANLTLRAGAGGAPGVIEASRKIDLGAGKLILSGNTVAPGAAGAGVIALRALNTYSGGTYVGREAVDDSDKVSVVATHGSAFGSGTFTLNTGRLYAMADVVLGGAFKLQNGSEVLTGDKIEDLAPTDFDNLNSVIGSLSAPTFAVEDGEISVTMHGGTVAVGQDSVTKTTSGAVTLSGANDFVGNVVVSAGTLYVSGSNTYGGSTSVNGGKLQISHSQALGTTAGATTVANAATLELKSPTAVVHNIKDKSARGYNLDVQEAITLAAGSAGSVLSSLSGVNRLTGPDGGSTAPITLTGLGKVGFAIASSGTQDDSSRLFVGAVTLDPVARTIVGAGKAITGSGADLDVTARWQSYTYSGDLAILGDLSLGTGKLTFDGGPYNSTVYGGGQLALMGDNSGTTGAMTLNGQILVGTPTAFGSNANVTLTGNSDHRYYYTNLLADVDMGTGKLTLQGDTLIKSTGKVQLVGGRAVVGYDGEFAATVTTQFGTIKAQQFALEEGEISVTMHGGTVAVGQDSVTKTTSGAVTLSGANDFVGNVVVSAGTLYVSGSNTYGGSTSVNGGKLQISHSQALGTTAGATTVANAATLELKSPTAVVHNIKDKSARGYNLDVQEAITLAAGSAGSVLSSLSGVNRLTGPDGGSTAPITLTGLGKVGFAIASSGTQDDSSRLFVGAVTLDPVARTIVGAGKAITGSGADLDVTARWQSYTYSGDLAILGDLSLGTGKLTFDGGPYNSTVYGGGQLALMGDNSGTTGAMTLNGQILVGTPTAFGSNANVTLTGNSDHRYYYTNLLADVDMGTGKLTLQGDTLIKSTGKVQLVGGRAVVGYDGEFAATVTTQFGTIKAQQFALEKGEISVQMRGGLSGVNSVTKTTAGVVSLKGSNIYVGITEVADGYLRVYGPSSLGLSGVVGSHTKITNGTLDIYESIPNLSEDFVLAGNGRSNVGAIRNKVKSSTLSGGVSLEANSRINNAVIDGTLTIGMGSAISGSYNLTIGGTGPVVIDRSIQTGTGGLYKDGSAQLTLNGVSSYSGVTSITTSEVNKGTGRFIVHGALNGAGAVTVGPSAVLGGTGTIMGPVTLNQHSGTNSQTVLEVGEALKDAASGRANLNLGSSLAVPGLATVRFMSPLAYADSDSGAPLEVGGNLILGGAAGSLSISLNHLSLTAGSYHLIKHGRTSGGVATTLGATDLAKLLLSPSDYVLSKVRIPASSRAVLVDRPGYVDLVVTGGVIYWKGVADVGGNPSQWDTLKTNWTLKTYDGTTPQPVDAGFVKFLTNDHVIFDDSPDLSAPTAITLTGLRDTLVTEFRNSIRDYSFSGQTISADTAKKSGAGLVSFNYANAFSQFEFEDGTVRAGANNVLGSGKVNVYGRPDDLSTAQDEGKRPRLSSIDVNTRTFANQFEFKSDQFILGDADPARNGRLTFSAIINLGGPDRSLTVESDVLFSSRMISEAESADYATAPTAAGVFRKRGQGRLIIAANNAFGDLSTDPDTLEVIYGGQIIVESGVLQIGNAGSTGSVLSNILNSGTVEFNRTGYLNYGAVLSGGGTLEKRGGGELDLTGDNSLTGQATVFAGTLKVNGSYAGNIDVRSGAFLGGSGRIGGNVVISGEHRPGNSPGIQTVSGNLSYSASSSLQWELTGNTSAQSDPAVYDQVIVGGNLAFSGPTSAKLVFNGAGSLVNWSDPFWATDQQWVVYDVAGSIAGEGNLTRLLENWEDGQRGQFNTLLPGASFALAKAGQNIVLNYDAGTIQRPGFGAGTNVNAGITYVNNSFPGGTTTVTNAGTPGAENIDATVTPGSGVTGGGTATGLVAGDTTGQTIGLNLSSPTAPGVITRTATVNFVSQPSSTNLTPVTVNVNGVVYERAAATLPASISFGSIRRGPTINQTFATTTISVTNYATSLQYLGAPLGDALSVSWINPTTEVLTTGSITSLAAQATSTALQVTLDSVIPAGPINRQVILRSVSEPPAAAAAEGFGQVVTDTPVTVTGRIYDHAIGSVDASDLAINLGRTRVGTPFRVEGIDITNNVAPGTYSESLGATLGSLSAGVARVGSLSGLLPGQTSQTLGVTITSTTVGQHFGFATITYITEAQAGSNLNDAQVSTQVISVTGIIDALAQAQIASQLNGGRVHAGGAFPLTDLSVTNGAPSGLYSDDLKVEIVQADSSLWHNAQTVSNLAGAATDTGTIQVRLLDASAPGEKSGQIILRSTSLSRGGLDPENLGTNVVTVSGLAYSGQGSWQGGSSDWTDGSIEAHWSRWERLGGIPGKDATLSYGDTATFAGSSVISVRLNGLSPEVAALNFDNSSGVSLTRAASESLTLGLGVASAEINVSAGRNTIYVPVALQQNLQVDVEAGASVDFRGGLAAPGATRVTLTGAGEIIMGSAVAGGLDLVVSGPTMTASANNTFADGMLESGRLASDGTSKTLTFDSLVKSGTAGSVGALGDIISPASLTIQSATPVQVNVGILRNNARVLAPINVGAGTTLGGRGSSQAVTLAANATFAPGNSIDTYTVNGDLNFHPASIFQVEVNGIAADRADVTGVANLGGLIEVRYLAPGTGLAAGQTYTILTYDSYSGTFNAADVNFDPATAAMYPSLDPELNILANRTELTFRLTANTGDPSPSVGALLGFFGRNSNLFVQSVVGDPYMKAGMRGPSLASGVTADSLLGAKDQLDQLVTGAASDGSWLKGYADASVVKQGGVWDFDHTVGGVSGGIDLYRSSDWVMGVALGTARSEARHHYAGDRSLATSYDLGFYSCASGDKSEVSFVAYFSQFDVQHTRYTQVGSIRQATFGNPDSYRAGVSLSWDGEVHSTAATKGYLRTRVGGGLNHRDAFRETGDASVAMNFDEADTPYFELDFGFGASHDLTRGSDTWRVYGEGMFCRRVAVGDLVTQARFNQSVSGSPVNVLSADQTYLMFRPSVGLSWQSGVSFADLRLSAELRSGELSPSATLNVGIRF